MKRTITRNRENQRRRTRKDLLQAAVRLMRSGKVPSMDEVADEASISRATAYRYFPNIEALLTEAPLDAAVPDPEELFARERSTDPVARVEQANAALDKMIYQNQAQLRIMLANTLTGALRGKNADAIPRRQNRRIPLIEAALAPAREDLDRATYETLCSALSLVLGTESMIVFSDVIPMSERRARSVKRWTIRALVNAALAEAGKERRSAG